MPTLCLASPLLNMANVTRATENNQITALKAAKGEFDLQIRLSALAVQYLNWWLINLPNYFNVIKEPVVDIMRYLNASLCGWGGVMGEMSTGGHWAPDEARQHVNYIYLFINTANFLSLHVWTALLTWFGSNPHSHVTAYPADHVIVYYLSDCPS